MDRHDAAATSAAPVESLARLHLAELDPKREKWYQEFFDRITTLGFNQDGDLKVKIEPRDLPVKPAGRTNQVIFKYGTDGE